MFDLSAKVRDVRFNPDPDNTKAGRHFTLHVGSSLICSATGSAPVTYEWVANGTTVSSGQELKITPGMAENNKNNIYTCIARNKYGEEQRAVEFRGKSLKQTSPPFCKIYFHLFFFYKKSDLFFSNITGLCSHRLTKNMHALVQIMTWAKLD